MKDSNDKAHLDDMSEEELARYFEANKESDGDIWEKKPRKIRIRRGSASTVFTLRLAPEELEAFQQFAASRKTTVSGFLREAGWAAVRGTTSLDTGEEQQLLSDIRSEAQDVIRRIDRSLQRH